MNNISKLLLFSILSFSLVNWAWAKSDYLIVANCLLSRKFSFKTLAANQDIALIRIEHFDEFQAIRIKRRADCRGFINVTHEWNQYNKTQAKQPAQFLKKFLAEPHPSDFTRSYKIKHQPLIRPLLNNMHSEKMREEMLELTALPDRNAHSLSGKYASNWLQKKIEALRAQYPTVETELIVIPTVLQSKQSSMILRIGLQNEPAIVVGAHFDTLNKNLGPQPGANDNASGTVTLLETARLLLASELTFKKPIYLIWYAGSEEGKIGSQSVVNYFNKSEINIDAVLELNQTGYKRKLDSGIGLADDSTDAGLNAYMADLAAAYAKVSVGAVHCGYACSDHTIWYQNGNHVVYPLSTMRDEGSPYVHTAKDTLENLSIEQMRHFVKLSVAFVIELAQPLVVNSAS